MTNQKSVLVRVVKGEHKDMVGRYIGDYIEGENKMAIIEMDSMWDVGFPYDHIKFIEN